MVNDCPHRRPCVCFAYARGTDGQIMRAVSAATEGSNARFWRHPSFTTRDDHAAYILNFGKSALRLRPPAGVFLWGATPVSLGKTKEMGWQKVLQGPALVPPRGASRRAMRPGAAWPPSAGRPPHSVRGACRRLSMPWRWNSARARRGSARWHCSRCPRRGTRSRSA